jgi:hypothetical protein
MLSERVDSCVAVSNAHFRLISSWLAVFLYRVSGTSGFADMACAMSAGSNLLASMTHLFLIAYFFSGLVDPRGQAKDLHFLCAILSHMVRLG